MDNRNRDAKSCTPKLNGKFTGLFHESRVSSSNRGAVCILHPPFDRESRNSRRVSRYGSPVENRENSAVRRCWVPIKWGRTRNCLRTDAKPIGVSKSRRDFQRRPLCRYFFFAICHFERSALVTLSCTVHMPSTRHSLLWYRRLAIPLPLSLFLYRLLIILSYRIVSLLDVYSFCCHLCAVTLFVNERIKKRMFRHTY